MSFETQLQLCLNPDNSYLFGIKTNILEILFLTKPQETVGSFVALRVGCEMSCQILLCGRSSKCREELSQFKFDC